MRLVRFLLLLSVCLPFLEVQAQVDYRKDAIYVRLQPGQTHTAISTNSLEPQSPDLLQSVFNTYGGISFTQAFPGVDAFKELYLLKFSQADKIENLISDLNALEFVKYAEMIPVPNASSVKREAGIAQVPGDMNDDLMWYIGQINMDWDLPLNLDFKVKIAVVDNGIRLSHEDIASNLWVNPGEGKYPDGIDNDGNGLIDDIHGADLADSNGNPDVPSSASNTYFGHGTKVAGIVSAQNNNGKGIVSVGVNAEVMAVKVVPDNPPNNRDDYYVAAYEGVMYAAMKGAHIINMSWGTPVFSNTQKDIIDFALAQGIILVAAAGNAGSNEYIYPAAFDGVIAVGATDDQDFKAPSSNYGPYIDVMAPGVKIYTTLAGSDNAYGTETGTSMSAPIVSAFAGLLLSQFPTKADQIELAIKKGCDNIEINNYPIRDQIGAGRINIHQSYELLKSGKLSVATQRSVQNIRLYPNPNAGVVYVPNEAHLSSLSVYDLNGKLVSSVPVQNQQADLRFLALKGMYLIRANSEEQQYVARIIFQ